MKNIQLKTALISAASTIAMGYVIELEDEDADRMIDAGMAKEFTGTDAELKELLVPNPAQAQEALGDKRAELAAKTSAAADKLQAERDGADKKNAARLASDKSKSDKAAKAAAAKGGK